MRQWPDQSIGGRRGQLWAGSRDYGIRATTTYGHAWAYTNAWEEGQQYIVFRDVVVNTNQPVTINVRHNDDGYATPCGLQIVFKGSADTNHNGLPDAWEMYYFGHIGMDPNADPDGDGYTNLQEYNPGPHALRVKAASGPADIRARPH